MRTPVWIIIVAVAGIVVAWLVLTQTPEPPLAAMSQTPMPAQAITVPPPAPPAVPDESAAVPALSTTAPEPAPAETKPASTAAIVEPRTAKPDQPATTDVAAGEESDASDDDDAGDESEPADDDTEAQSFDAHRAADLLADWMARDDAAPASDDSAPQPNTQALKTFDQEESDPHWSASTAQQIETSLDQWLDALPDDLRGHVDVIHVECHMTLCQILAAENDIALEDQRVQASQNWAAAISSLSQQAWWSADGFKSQWTVMAASDSTGYNLYQTYLRRGSDAPE